MQAGRITTGPLFRPVDRHGRVRDRALSGEAIAAIAKRAVKRAALDPATSAGHLLRAGFCTQAACSGATAFDIMRQTHHRSVATVSRYVRDAQLFRDAPAGKLGL